jgi:hypothetical protein
MPIKIAKYHYRCRQCGWLVPATMGNLGELFIAEQCPNCALPVPYDRAMDAVIDQIYAEQMKNEPPSQ